MGEEEGKKTCLGMSRRAFTIGTGGAVALLAMGGLKFIPEQALVRPPGGQDEDAFISSCIRCERCVEACPEKALTLAHLEDGILSARTPTANFNVGWCDFCAESNNGRPKCVEVCPTQALKLPEDAQPETTIIGKAVINKDWCLAYSKLNGCRFCYDACEYEAIELDEYNRPVIIPDKCNGCGACQCACVSMEEGSITEGATARAVVVVPEQTYNENYA